MITQIKDNKVLVWTGNLGNGDEPNNRLEVHHCVPVKMDTAKEAHAILDKWQIGINDPVNAAIVPHSFHFGNTIHGSKGAHQRYGDLISKYMAEVDKFADAESASLGGGEAGFKAGKSYVMDSLRNFCDKLTADSKDSRAILFQNALRSVEKGARQIVNGN